MEGLSPSPKRASNESTELRPMADLPALGSQSSVEEADRYYKLGMAHLFGDKDKDIAPDYEQAKHHFQCAMDLGSAGAYNSMGILYDRGLGVQRDSEKAFTLYQQSVERGFSGAYINLGLSYLEGDGVPENPVFAIQTFLKGAKMGVPHCCEQIGRMVSNGSPYWGRIWVQKAWSMQEETRSQMDPEAITQIDSISIEELAKRSGLSQYYADACNGQ